VVEVRVDEVDLVECVLRLVPLVALDG